MTPLAIEVTTTGADARMLLIGEVDLAGHAAIREAVSIQATDPGITAVIVDLTRTTFIDSAGIAILIGCRRLAVDLGKTLRVIGAHGHVRTVLDVAGITRFLEGHG